MYTEVGCTPSRAAAVTGRMAIRNGMYNIGMLLEMHGIGEKEVTLAEVLSEKGCATAFHCQELPLTNTTKRPPE